MGNGALVSLAFLWKRDILKGKTQSLRFRLPAGARRAGRHFVALAAASASGSAVVDLGTKEFAPLRKTDGAVAGGEFPVIVTRLDQGRFAAFGSECMHWSCEVVLPDAKGIVRCPCHTSRFDREGQLIDGEAQEDLLRVEIEIQAATAVERRSWGRIKKDRS
jgi:nitrite reductase/ring-hydroxylating ferredoxin subunit